MEFSSLAKQDASSQRNIDVFLTGLKKISDINPSPCKELHNCKQTPIQHFAEFKSDYGAHVALGLDSVVMVGFGQVNMHYAVALIMLRGIPSRNIFIVDKGEHVGGCLHQGNTFGWFGAPSNPLIFYPWALYASVYHKMDIDTLGVSCPMALSNMFIVQEHFGLRVYMATEYEQIRSLLHGSTRVVKPYYRDVISGRGAGATNGIEAVDLRAQTFHLVGMGSTTADVLVELCLRRVQAHGQDFNIVLQYRTPRRFSAYLGTVLQPPSVYPFYYASPLSTLGHRVDKFIITRLAKETGKYTEVLKYIDVYDQFEKVREASGRATAFAVGMNLLQLHPAVAQRLTFVQVKDKTEVQVQANEPVIDCTNTTNYAFIPHETYPEVDFAPNMNGAVPTLSKLVWGTQDTKRLPAPLMAQWSTAYGAIGHALYGHHEMDADASYLSCIAQCNGTWFFARYHSISRFFLLFVRVPTLIQIVVAMLYDATMRLFAITGFTLLFFSSELYSASCHQTGEQSVAILAARWKWFGQKCQDDTPFPCTFEELPGVPNCFSYVWMARSKNRLLFRMILTACVLSAWVICSLYESTASAVMSAAGEYARQSLLHLLE